MYEADQQLKIITRLPKIVLSDMPRVSIPVSIVKVIYIQYFCIFALNLVVVQSVFKLYSADTVQLAVKPIVNALWR